MPLCSGSLPPDASERAVLIVLRFIAAARDTGDACCWDAALDRAEEAFGSRRGPLVVGTAGALVRRLVLDGADIGFLPPPCRRLSSGEALLLDALRERSARPSRLALGPWIEDVAALARCLAPPAIARGPRAARGPRRPSRSAAIA